MEKENKTKMYSSLKYYNNLDIKPPIQAIENTKIFIIILA